jgi:hypothetical protein
VIAGSALFLPSRQHPVQARDDRRPTLSHWIGLGSLAVLSPFALVPTPLDFGICATALSVIAAIWETRSYAYGPRPAPA